MRVVGANKVSFGNFLRSVAALACVAVSPLAFAGQADICYSPTVTTPLGTYPPATSNTTVFNCPQAGSKTLPQLAADGWQVVQLGSVVIASAGTTLDSADQIVIQKP